MPPLRSKALLPVALSALAALGASLALAAAGSPAAAQDTGAETETDPAGGVDAPEYRDDGPYLLVCTGDAEDFADRNAEVAYNQRIVNERLYPECAESGYRGLDQALEAVAEAGTRIQILPGHYTLESAVVVEGATDLQIEGLGDGPEDVHLSGRFADESVLEVRDSTGMYLKGLTVQGGRETGLLMDSVEGATVEAVSVIHNGHTGLRVNDSSAIAVTACTATGNDAAGIAIASSEAFVTGCEASGNLIGLLLGGTGEADVTSNRLHDNTTGLITTGGTSTEIRSNAVYDNNADHYENLESGSCDLPPAERNWSEGIICPAQTAPIGVGILIAAANDTTVADNHIWGQNTAAAMVWGAGGVDDTVPHRNRFEGNSLGLRDEGGRSRNRLDLWWDGRGEGNCFDEPTALHTTPAVLPGCDDTLTPARVLGEPVKTFKVWQCGTDLLAETGTTAGCDWFGAKFTDRLEFQATVVFAAALLFLTGAGWLGAARSPVPPPPMAMTFSAIATGSAAVLWVLASWSGRSDYEALAIGLWGAGWLLAGRAWFASKLHAFGAFTVLIAVLAVLDAIDRGVQMIPVLPVSPAWMWLVLLPLWLLLALGAMLRHYEKEPEPLPAQRTPVTVPEHNRFDW